MFVIIQEGVFAHALLERAIPAPDSQLSSSPSDITLTFNERLERELFYIKVFNSQGRPVMENPTEMSQNQKELHLSLPTLEDDVYTVTYSVISADGHPIRGSYVISVGKAPISEKTDQADHVHGEHEASTQIGIFGIRIFYFFSLLLISGWIAWGHFLPIESIELQKIYLEWTSYLQKVYLFTLLAMIFVQLGDLLTDWGFNEITALLFKTSTGLSLTLSLFLSILGFFILRRKKWVDAVWVIMLLTAKSISGHAIAFEPPMRTVLLDMVHLLAASIWTGGLCYLLLFWKGHREPIMRFLPLFSKAALASITVLAITGTLSTLIFLPKLSYIFETTWGILLLAKVFLVGLVIMVGAILRQGIKKKSIDQINIGLKVDVGLMTLIVIIVGVFTYLSPLPPNQPLYWHDRSKSVPRITTQITPNVPGVNHFSVDVSLTKPELKIKQVELSLTYQDDPEIAPIKVPLKAELPGEHHFVSDGPYLPFAGSWTAEVRVMDSEDNETVYTKDFTIY
ncbi:copper resistance CopC/CopD family protein [Ammoniphilus sp. 3BR4]|uniref:copper resistance CopC/CopD family protein n=1 Tax=Ammoniphilus sp. 3BR4 TaxID=3158265 RepID=UPI003466C756